MVLPRHRRGGLRAHGVVGLGTENGRRGRLALEDSLRDEPDWRALLRVEQSESASMLRSAN